MVALQHDTMCHDGVIFNVMSVLWLPFEQYNIISDKFIFFFHLYLLD